MGTLHKAMLHTGVQVPKPLSYDCRAAVLISSYIGDVHPLSTLFGAICMGNINKAMKQPSDNLIQGLMYSRKSMDSYFKSVGKSFGSFLAKLHDPKVAKELLQSWTPPLLADFESRGQSILTYLQDVQHMRERLRDWPWFFPSADELSAICDALEVEAVQQHLPDE